MPRPLSRPSSNKREWRRKNPDGWQDQKHRYYARSAGAMRSYERWTSEDVAIVTAPDRPSDRDLSKLLLRSVQAIQVKRAKVEKPLALTPTGRGRAEA